MPDNTYDLIVLLLALSFPFVLAGLWVFYRLVRGHRWRQQEILHTNIEILQTNQAILAALLGSLPKDRHQGKKTKLKPVHERGKEAVKIRDRKMQHLAEQEKMEKKEEESRPD